MTTTFATPIINKPCEHEYRYTHENMLEFVSTCIYCGKTEIVSRLHTIDC